MTAIIVLVCLALIAAGAVIYIRGRNQRQRELATGSAPAGALGSGPRFSKPSGSGVRQLKLGDVVNYEARDYIVEGTIVFDQDGFKWHEHLLVDGSDKLWLSVEDDEGLEVAVWQRVPGSELVPGAKTVQHAGVSYELDEQGRATFTAEGSTGTGASGHVEYADYEGPGDQLLSFERYGSDASWEVSVGKSISEHLLDVYPGRGL